MWTIEQTRLAHRATTALEQLAEAAERLATASDKLTTAAELEVLASKSLCNKSCALFGQCPFVEDVTKCEKYNAPRFED